MSKPLRSAPFPPTHLVEENEGEAFAYIAGLLAHVSR